jgi:hypothetical protein
MKTIGRTMTESQFLRWIQTLSCEELDELLEIYKGINDGLQEEA